MHIILAPSNCQGNLSIDIGHNVTKNCTDSWNTCQMHLESSLFHGNIKSQGSGEYTNQSQIANLNTIVEFYCDNGWRLHPAIKEVTKTENVYQHKVVCKKYGWFSLMNDGETTGPKLIPCIQMKQCQVIT